LRILAGSDDDVAIAAIPAAVDELNIMLVS
jgi:hypothetical protein